jgi:hypothetical protein
MSRQAFPILTLTRTLSGTVAANRFVTPSGAQAGADANTLGVARSGGVSGDKIPVDVLGTAVVEAGAAISEGATLETDASGRAVTWATSGPKVGIALEAAGAAGQFIEVLLIPNAA